jgi:hypothetical protein
VIDEFYIGYEPAMPSGLSLFIRLTAVALVMLSFAVAGILVAAQTPSSGAVFHYGKPQSLEGRLVESPYPAIEVTDRSGNTRWYWLVGPGKHGVAAMVRGFDGQRVRLSGTLIEREGDAMLEVVAGAITVRSSARAPAIPLRTIGPRTLDGEIVDSKCYLGVMKPGEGPTHRDCAVRCLLGQVPPMLAVREHGTTRRLPLVMMNASGGGAVLPALTGRPVRVHGVLLARGEQQFLSVSESSIAVRESADASFSLWRFQLKSLLSLRSHAPHHGGDHRPHQ